MATAALVVSVVWLFLFSGGESPYEVARNSAVSIGLALAVGMYFEMKNGLRNLFRVDVVCLLALYGLTLAEFLVDQPIVNDRLNLIQAEKGLDLVYIGFGALALGRHLVKPPEVSGTSLKDLPPLPPKVIFICFLLCFFIGHFYMFIAVDFNPIALYENLMGPRFGVPWGRGRYGTFSTLLNELNLLSYLIPPVTGLMLARRKQFTRAQIAIALTLFLVTLFIVISRGSRNVLAIHLATFLIAHIFSLTRLRIWYLSIICLTGMGLFLFVSFHMLEFRNMGLKAYLAGSHYDSEEIRDSIFIDMNLVSLGKLADRFPGEYQYLGAEVAIWAIVKPVPRAFWPGKPKGLSIDIEQALGETQATVAATFIGEAYMGGGKIGVAFAGLVFGLMFAWWNRLAAGSDSALGLLIYASGFFGGVICMRSMFWLTTGILPAVALLVFGKYIYPRLVQSS